MDPNIEPGDKVEVHGLYQGYDDVALFGSEDYYIKKADECASLVKFKGSASTDESYGEFVCYGSYYCTVKVEEVLQDPDNILVSGNEYQVCYGATQKNIKTGDKLEVFGDYYPTCGPLQCVGNIVASGDGYYVEIIAEEAVNFIGVVESEPSEPYDIEMRIDEVLLDPEGKLSIGDLAHVDIAEDPSKCDVDWPLHQGDRVEVYARDFSYEGFIGVWIYSKDNPNDGYIKKRGLILPVPYEHQVDTAWCVLASCAMVLQYYGAWDSYGDEEVGPIHFWDIAKFFKLKKDEPKKHHPFPTFGVGNLREYLANLEETTPFHKGKEWYYSRGLFSDANLPEDIKNKIIFCLNNDTPVIVGGKWKVLPGGHAVVIVGYEKTESDDIILYISDPSGALTEEIGDIPRRIAAPVTWDKFNDFEYNIPNTEVLAFAMDVPLPINGKGSLEFSEFSIKKTDDTLIYYADFSKGFKWHDASTQKPVCYIDENVEMSSEDFNHISIWFSISNHCRSRQEYKVLLKDAKSGWESEPQEFSTGGYSFGSYHPSFHLEDIGLGSHSLYIELYESDGDLADRIGPFRFEIIGTVNEKKVHNINTGEVFSSIQDAIDYG
jgi:hypothetical protein